MNIKDDIKDILAGLGIVSIAFALMIVIFPGAAGIINFLKENKDLAPWISGSATTAGVIAALYNAKRALKLSIDRQEVEDNRKIKESEEDLSNYRESATEIVSMVMFNIELMRKDLISGPEEAFIGCGGDMASLKITQRMMANYPITKIRNRSASAEWHKMEIFLSELSDEYIEGEIYLKNHNLKIPRNNKSAYIITQTALTSCEHISTAATEFSDHLGIPLVKWTGDD